MRYRIEWVSPTSHGWIYRIDRIPPEINEWLSRADAEAYVEKMFQKKPEWMFRVVERKERVRG